MTTGIAQKCYKALFPLWSLKKKYIEINKLKITHKKDWKHWEESWYWNKEKGKNYAYPFCINSKKVTNFIFVST